MSLLVLGKSCPIHKVEVSLPKLKSNELAALMKWNGGSNILIDRYDVRAFMDIMPKTWGEKDINLTDEHAHDANNNSQNDDAEGASEDIVLYKHTSPAQSGSVDTCVVVGGVASREDTLYEEENKTLERLLNFERYRTLVEAHRRMGSSISEASQVETRLLPKVASYIQSSLLLSEKDGNKANSHNSKGSSLNLEADDSFQYRTNAPLPSSCKVGVEGQYGRVGYMYNPSEPPPPRQEEGNEEYLDGAPMKPDDNGVQQEERSGEKGIYGEDGMKEDKLNYLSDIEEFDKMSDGKDKKPPFLVFEELEAIAAAYGITLADSPNSYASIKKKAITYDELSKLDKRVLLRHIRSSRKKQEAGQRNNRKKRKSRWDQSTMDDNLSSSAWRQRKTCRDDDGHYYASHVRRRRSPSYGDEYEKVGEAEEGKEETVQYITSFDKKETSIGNGQSGGVDEIGGVDEGVDDEAEVIETLASFFPFATRETLKFVTVVRDYDSRENYSSDSDIDSRRREKQRSRSRDWRSSGDRRRNRSRSGERRRSRSRSEERRRSRSGERRRSRSGERRRSRSRSGERRRSRSGDRRRSRSRSGERRRSRSRSGERRRSRSGDRKRDRSAFTGSEYGSLNRRPQSTDTSSSVASREAKRNTSNTSSTQPTSHPIGKQAQSSSSSKGKPLTFKEKIAMKTAKLLEAQLKQDHALVEKKQKVEDSEDKDARLRRQMRDGARKR